jgi:hypothetical protein
MEEKYPELQDIIQAIKKYSVLNPTCTFLFGIVAYKDGEERCEECDEIHECIDDEKSSFGIFGHILEIRNMLNSMRDFAEEEVDENGMVNY